MPAADARRRGLLSALREQRGLLGVCALLQAGAGLAIAGSFLVPRRTLATNGHWISTKTTLERSLMGARGFVEGPQALAGGRLDLGAWHGYQEVQWHEPMQLERLEIDFYLPPASHLSVLFGCTPEEGCAGFRLSNIRRLPSLFFVADAEGRFLDRQPLSLELARRRWRRASVELADGSARLSLDGLQVALIDVERRAGRFGFRGAERGALVDNVEAIEARGRRVEEDFEAAAGPPYLLAVLPAALALLGLAAFAALVASGRLAPQRAALTLATLSLTLAALAGLSWAFSRWRGGRYPAVDPALAAAEEGGRAATIEETRRRIRERYAEPPAPGTTRVLVVGSSQTWGAGARRAEETWVRRLEGELQARVGPQRRVECIEAAIPAARAAHLAPLLEGDWLPLAPHIVVINLASNDRSRETFRRALDAMAAAVRAAGARLLLVQEANAPEAADAGLRVRHAAMAEVAARHGVPVLDMHGHLLALADQGFLWWDEVHLTSFGQRLLAARVAEALAPWVAEEAAGGYHPPRAP